MFYLITQIVFFLIIAVLTGMAIGWWLHSKTQPSKLPFDNDLSEDPFDARFRLEQCHRDNATLRRDLKESEEQLEKLQHRLEHTEHTDDDVLERLETSEIRVQALLEDLQSRDDTIAILERELKDLREFKDNNDV